MSGGQAPTGTPGVPHAPTGKSTHDDGPPAPRVNTSADHDEDLAVTGDGASFPPSASMCHKCHNKAVVMMDGCATCLNCGYSKCG